MAAGDVEEPRHEVDQSGLARAGGTDDCSGLARLGPEGHALKHRRLGAGVVEVHLVEDDLADPGRMSVTASAGSATEDSVSSTSPMRSADTDALGIIIAMKVAIITEMRIWIR